MGIKESAIRILVTMAEYSQQADDPERGHYHFANTELAELLGLNPHELGDAVAWLEERGCVDARHHLGTHPFSFAGVTLTARGRLEAEEHSGRPQAHELDALLKIRNRGSFDNDLRIILAQNKSGQIPVVLVMIDLDHFKPFNDDYGHPAGDRVLEETAAAISRAVGRKGECYRYGGDEFVAVLPNYTQAEAIPLTERIKITVASIDLAGLPRISVTVGLAGSESIGYDPAALLAAADQAMYAVKHPNEESV